MARPTSNDIRRLDFEGIMQAVRILGCALGLGLARIGYGVSDVAAGEVPYQPIPVPECVADMASVPKGTDVYSVRSGAWSDGRTWSKGKVPAAGDDVVVRRCVSVTYDILSHDPLRTLLVNGQLLFSTAQNTQLAIGLMVVTPDPRFDVLAGCKTSEMGHMEHDPFDPHVASFSVGTPSAPISQSVRARILLAPMEGLDDDCAPALIAHGGRMEFHGAPLTATWSKLSATAAAGATLVRLAEPVDWRRGDKLILTATKQIDLGRYEERTYANGGLQSFTEERMVTGVEAGGTTIKIDQPLEFEHAVVRMPRGELLSGEVGNLSRNIVIESQNPEGPYGHVMFHHGSQGSISYTEFHDLGKPGALGRYPLHFHLPNDTMRGTSIIGASIWGGHNRWLAEHGIEYLVVRDLVAYQTIGHGVYLENASEQYNLLDHSLLVQAAASRRIPRQSLEYDENHGSCYWSANARNFVSSTVLVECGDSFESMTFDYAHDPQRTNNSIPMPTTMLMPDGTRMIVDARTVSGGLYRDLELHNNAGWGFWIRGAKYPADEPLMITNLKLWKNHYSAELSGDNIFVDKVFNHFTPYGFYNQFPGPLRIRDAYMNYACGQGAFMTIRGGHGIQLYENLVIENCPGDVFRIDASQENGTNGGQRIEIHARNFSNVGIRNPSGAGATAWAGTEDNNSRTDPLLMLVLHDAFGAHQDAVVIPATMSTTIAGLPPNLSFVSGGSLAGPQGLMFQGRGATRVARAKLDFPTEHSLMHPTDRIPPATIITAPTMNERLKLDAKGRLIVRGVSLDTNLVKAVTVNGVAATVAADGMDWQVTLSEVRTGGIDLEAKATDTRGLTEKMPHRIRVWVE